MVRNHREREESGMGQSSAPDRRAESKYGEWEMLLARLGMNKRAPREWKVGTRSRMCNAAVAGAEYFGGVVKWQTRPVDKVGAISQLGKTRPVADFSCGP